MKLSSLFAIIISIVIVVGVVYSINMEDKKVKLVTSDNKNIIANLYAVKNPRGWIILSHMMPATKESWEPFVLELQKIGYESLAIDLRGHGESDGGPDGFSKFSDREHRASINDLESAWEFMKSRGAKAEKTVVIGASIGANLSLEFLTMHSDLAGGILLSPGNYKGIDSLGLVKELDPEQKMLFVASKLDNRTAGNNAEQNRGYYDSASQVKNRHIIIYDGAGHGTDLFGLKEEYDLTRAIKLFLTTGRIN